MGRSGMVLGVGLVDQMHIGNNHLKVGTPMLPGQKPDSPSGMTVSCREFWGTEVMKANRRISIKKIERLRICSPFD